MTHSQMVTLLAEHGFTPYQNTAWYPKTGLEAINTSFYFEFGHAARYSRTVVMAWLGY